MKKVIFSLFIFTFTIFVYLSTVSASSAFETVITEKDGTIHIEDGIVQVSGNAESYEIRYNGKRLITVMQNNTDDGIRLFGTETMLNGYYSVEFEVSQAEGTSAFITGLSRSNKDEVQNALVNAAYAEN